MKTLWVDVDMKSLVHETMHRSEQVEEENDSVNWLNQFYLEDGH